MHKHVIKNGDVPMTVHFSTQLFHDLYLPQYLDELILVLIEIIYSFDRDMLLCLSTQRLNYRTKWSFPNDF